MSQNTRIALRNPPCGPTSPHFSCKETKAREGEDAPRPQPREAPEGAVAQALLVPAHAASRPLSMLSLPGSPLPTLLVMVWLCSRVTALFTATDSSSWHHDLSRAHSGFSRRRVTWLTKVPIPETETQQGVPTQTGRIWPSAELPHPSDLTVTNSAMTESSN